MSLRITLFVVFQIIAWSIFLNSESDPSSPEGFSKSQKVVEILEQPNSQFASINNTNSLYKLVLRNDGFFTKINSDQTVSNGLWDINYDIPTIILKLPQGEFEYKILAESNESMELELIHDLEVIQAMNIKTNSPSKLFSTLD